MNKPFFSVVIPTYNRAGFVRHAIDSVLQQSFREFEVIVVDDGSTDETGAIVKSITDPRVKYFRKANGERASARNFGVDQSQGAYINFLDSDDSQYPHHLQTAYDFLTTKSVDVVHLGYDMKSPEGKLLRTVEKIKSISRQILSGNVLSCNGVFARREVLLANPFNTDRGLSSLEDWELWIRLAARYSFHHVEAVTSTVIDHEQRSVVSGHAASIERKVNLLIKYATSDVTNIDHYGNQLSQVSASAHTYAALHLRMAGAPVRDSVRHFLRAIRVSPGVLFTRRSAVIILMILGIKRKPR